MSIRAPRPLPDKEIDGVEVSSRASRCDTTVIPIPALEKGLGTGFGPSRRLLQCGGTAAVEG